GQINGNQSDTKFGISQSFALPVVYKRQKEVLKENYNSKILETNLKEFEVKRTVTQLFYNFLFLKEKQKLLQKADSLYGQFLEKANLRLKKGESNLLEKSTAETQKTAIAMQLKQLKTEIEMNQLEFQLVLNSEENFVPFASNFKAVLPEIKVEENPRIKYFAQQTKISEAETALQKSRLWPEIIVGYNNNSFKGIGLDDAARYHSAQVGLAVPLFGGSQKAKINASKIAETVASATYSTALLNLQTAQKKLQLQHQTNLEIVDYLETNSTKNGQTIANLAYKQFTNGEINYLDYVMLINQSISIQNNYIEAVKSLNDSVIALQFLFSN
ncbi:MAG: TolC family protein, partial [Bacteroidota bacterium]|nr:TolC family protein [Bacteroidota bacterium]